MLVELVPMRTPRATQAVDENESAELLNAVMFGAEIPCRNCAEPSMWNVDVSNRTGPVP